MQTYVHTMSLKACLLCLFLLLCRGIKPNIQSAFRSQFSFGSGNLLLLWELCLVHTLECAYMVGKIKPGWEGMKTDVRDRRDMEREGDAKRLFWDRMSTVGVKHNKTEIIVSIKLCIKTYRMYCRERNEKEYNKVMEPFLREYHRAEPEESCSEIKKRTRSRLGAGRVVEVAPKWRLFVQTWALCLVFPSYLWSELYSLSYITSTSKLKWKWLSSVILNLCIFHFGFEMSVWKQHFSSCCMKIYLCNRLDRSYCALLCMASLIECVLYGHGWYENDTEREWTLSTVHHVHSHTRGSVTGNTPLQIGATMPTQPSMTQPTRTHQIYSELCWNTMHG